VLSVRHYRPEDYDAVAALYKRGDLYGGQFDEDRDSRERLNRVTTDDPESILVCEESGKIVGTVSLLENARTAWLFRFATTTVEAAEALHKKASSILKARVHRQVLVYAPRDSAFKEKFAALGFTEGGEFACFWTEIK